MRSARVDTELVYTLGGWSGNGERGNSVGDIYGSGFPIALLHEAIAQIAYEVPALASLMSIDHPV